MTLETFFEKFELFADAPDAVAKMRGLVLRLAMQGNLSEPHKGDTPVADLLVDVEKERNALGIKHSQTSRNENQEAEFFQIPARWTWTPFGELARHNAGKTLDKGRNRGELRNYITTSNLYWGFFQLDDVRQMAIEDDELDRCTATKGDLLIVEGGEAGRAAVWCYDYDIAFQNHIHRARFFAGIDPYFVQRYFETLNATGDIGRFRKGVGISNMSGKALASIPIPLPPLAEQKRIVAKVDELMAVCDRLERQQQERETRHAALARASLARFAEAPTVANLQFLFHDAYAIPPADLRKSILTLAVQGKLVPQDPNDEPADTFLEVIAQRLNKSKGKRSTNNGAAVADEAKPFDLPAGWAWSRFHDLGEFGRGKSKHRPRNDPSLFTGGNHRLVQTGDVARANGTIETHTGLYNDVGLAQSKMWPAGTLCITIAANIADSGILGFDACFPDSVVGFIPAPPIPSVRYFEYFMRTAKENLERFAPATAQKNINLGILEQVWIPIPPLAEQRRIVAKVDELMALVDALETQLATARSTAANLLAAAVAELTGTPATGKVSTPAASGPARRGRRASVE